MKILLLGSGGREHALALKLLKGPTPVRLAFAPGSDALSRLGPCFPISHENLMAIQKLCQSEAFDLVVVGPEAPLVAGVADAVRSLGIPVFGHGAATARLEGSKDFAKAFMNRHGIPCAWSQTIQDFEEGRRLIESWSHSFPIVLKADGLAAGKGVVLAPDRPSAHQTLEAFLGGALGEASKKVVLEEGLSGFECSVHVLVDVDADHARCVMLPPCQDHKRLMDGDVGPNTGGMGAFAPIPFLSNSELDQLKRELIQPTLKGLQSDGLKAQGVLFLGVMWTSSGPKLLEYNVRFGDPETQVLMELMEEDLPQLLLSIAQGELHQDHVRIRSGCVLSVVLAAEGYPDAPVKGVPIAFGDPVVNWIHAGTQRVDDQWVTAGGRVLNLVVRAKNLDSARKEAERLIATVSWPGMQWRKDIGLKAQLFAEQGRQAGDQW